MEQRACKRRSTALLGYVVLIALMLGVFSLTKAQAFDFTLNVVDQNGNPVSGFRWLVEEDNTFHVDPNAPPVTDPVTGNIVSVKLSNHISYAPVISNGKTGGTSQVIAVPDGKRYFVSVLPDANHSQGGVQVDATGAVASGTAYTALVQANPLAHWPNLSLRFP